MNKIITIDVGGTNIKMAIMNTDGEVLARTSIPSLSDGKFVDRLPFIKQAVDKMTNGCYEGITAVGISLPCLVDSEKKVATEIYGKFEDLPNVDLEKWCRDTFNLPLFVDQDSKLALLGEVAYGAGKGHKDVLMVIMGTGVGTAVMLDGKLLKGHTNSAGVLSSHIIIEYKDGRKCTCKGRGCLEAYTSTWALKSMIEENPKYSHSLMFGKTPDFKTLFECKALGDELANEIAEDVIDALRAGLISLIHCFDPELIILSGGPINNGDVFMNPLKEGLMELTWGKNRKTQIVAAKNPNESVLLGLCSLVKNM